MPNLSSRPLGVAEQRRLLAERLGHHALSDLESGTIVVVPSMSFPIEELRKIVGIQHYEERMLFMALLLDRPDLEMIYVTSAPIDEQVIDYYLSFLPDPIGARKRLHLVALDDTRPQPLSEKLLGRKDKIDEIRSQLQKENFALAFNVTDAEWHLMESLDLIVYGAHPDLARLGSKSGARDIARRAGVDLLPGASHLMSIEDVERAVIDLSKDTPASSAVIKLNNGFSGQGNAIVSLEALRSPLADTETVFCASEESWPSFATKIAAEGAVVEQLMREPGTVSPSTQMRIAADGSFEVVSTHDQILGGPDDQVYLGCRFPADESYRGPIQDAGRKIASVLADEGVVGSFGIDFVIASGDPSRTYLSEINLRMGGTSHPFYMARFVTRGHYDEDTGHLVAGGRQKFYVASDNIKSESYIGLRPEQIISVLDDQGLAYDHNTRTGATLHLLGALQNYGKLGCVAIADSRSEATELYDEVVAVLDSIS